MRTCDPDDESDDVKIDWIEAGIFRTCLVKPMTRKQFGLCSRLEVDVTVWVSSMPVLSEQCHKRYD
jgi:hypothetical protein